MARRIQACRDTGDQLTASAAALAAAMAAVDDAAPSRVVRWTEEADAILRRATVKRLSLRATAGILSDYFGRSLSRDAIVRRVEALGI